MPALAQPTGTQLIDTLLVGGAGAQLGDWTNTQIDTYIADALVNKVTEGFNFNGLNLRVTGLL
jgi:hypothetical protein